MAAYCTRQWGMQLFNKQIGIRDSDRFELFNQQIVLDNIVDRADPDAQQDRIAGEILIDKRIVDAGGPQHRQATFRVGPVAEGADLNVNVALLDHRSLVSCSLAPQARSA